MVLVCNIMIDEEIWLALFRILLGVWCLLMHANEGEIRNFPSFEEKLEIKSLSENKRNRGNHGIMAVNRPYKNKALKCLWSEKIVVSFLVVINS